MELVRERRIEEPAGREPSTGGNELSNRGRLLLALSLLCLGILYFGITVYFASFRAFWSPDAGARFAMIRNWVAHGNLLRLDYPSRDIDPAGQISSLAYFEFHQPHGFCVMYPLLFPFLCGLAYRALGFAGLTVVPLCCGLGCLGVTYATARRLGLRSRPWLPLVMGLATPLLLYSVVFWDHSALMLVAALTAYWMLRAVQDDSLRSAAAAGAFMGLGVWLHELFLALFAAAWLAALPLLKSRRRIAGGLLLGFLPVLLLWGLFNGWVYGTPAGPHLGANVFQNSADHPFSLGRILDRTGLTERAMAQLVGTAIFDAPSDLFPYYLLLACLLIVYSFAAWSDSILAGLAPVLGLAAGATALYLVLGLHGRYTPAGLFEATPLLIPALGVPWYVRNPRAVVPSDEVFYAWLSRTCWLWILFLLINPMLPGTDWGSRYLLSALPLLVLLSAHALEHQWQGWRKRGRSILIISAAALVGISLVCQVLGLIWIHRSLVYGQELNARVRALPSPVLVTDADIGARLAYPKPAQAQYLVRSDDDQRLFFSILQKRNVTDMVFVGTPSGLNGIENMLVLEGSAFTTTTPRLLFAVDSEREEGDELQMVRFFLKPKGQGRHE